jgi:hypothetical protein
MKCYNRVEEKPISGWEDSELWSVSASDMNKYLSIFIIYSKKGKKCGFRLPVGA